MDRFMLLEQTTPNDSLDSCLCADGGGAPGGVMGRGSFSPADVEGAMVAQHSSCLGVCR